MDTPGGRQVVPGSAKRLHGGDRSGLGEKGWAAEDEESGIGRPDDTNVDEAFHQPLSPQPPQRES